jgi:hypothetical protein
MRSCAAGTKCGNRLAHLKMPLGSPLREFLGENCRLKYAMCKRGAGRGIARDGKKNMRASGCV